MPPRRRTPSNRTPGDSRRPRTSRRQPRSNLGMTFRRPIQTEDGLKARSQRGAFAKSWWAARWIEAMERLVDAARLTRGRVYARKGQVIAIEEITNGVEARVQGTRSTPYRITIQLTPFSDGQWDKIIDALAEQAIFTAQLLAGEMPHEIDDAFRSAGSSLFPTHRGDLLTSCSCPDWSNPCKHVAAAHYILGERFDEDPFLLFRLRGRSQEQILQALRRRRAGMEVGQTAEPAQTRAALAGSDEYDAAQFSPETLKRYYDLAGPLDAFAVTIQAPSIEVPMLKRLGEPTFAEEPGLRYLLLPAYRLVSLEAIQAAYGDAAKAAAEDSPPANGSRSNAA